MDQMLTPMAQLLTVYPNSAESGRAASRSSARRFSQHGHAANDAVEPTQGPVNHGYPGPTGAQIRQRSYLRVVDIRADLNHRYAWTGGVKPPFSLLVRSGSGNWDFTEIDGGTRVV